MCLFPITYAYLFCFILQMNKQDSSFLDEKKHFENILSKLKIFCREVKSPSQNQNKTLIIETTNFNQEFKISVKDCVYMTKKETDFQKILVSKTKEKRKRLGYTDTNQTSRVYWNPEC